MTTTLRVHFDGNVLVPEQPVDLPIGTSVQIRIEDISRVGAVAGTPAAVLAAVFSEPHVSKEDVAELERAIDEATLPLSKASEFGSRKP